MQCRFFCKFKCHLLRHHAIQLQVPARKRPVMILVAISTWDSQVVPWTWWCCGKILMLRILFPVCVLFDLRIEFFCPGHYSLSFLSWILFLPSLIFWTFWWLEFPSGAASLNPNERSLSKTGRFTSAGDIPLFLNRQVYFSSRYSCVFVHIVHVIVSLSKTPGEEKIPCWPFLQGAQKQGQCSLWGISRVEML